MWIVTEEYFQNGVKLVKLRFHNLDYSYCKFNKNTIILLETRIFGANIVYVLICNTDINKSIRHINNIIRDILIL